jgi:hypothetical protein
MTRQGTKAYQGHVAALREIVDATTVATDG